MSLGPGLRRFLSTWHGLIGISAGVVLSVMGLSGAAIAFEEEILRALNPGVATVALRDRPLLTAPQLQARLRADLPQRQILAVTVFADPERAAKAMLAVAAPPEATAAPAVKRADIVWLDPHDGDLLGSELRGEAVLHGLEDLHRRLLAGDAGKAVTGACAILLLVLGFSGLYLRWPRQPGSLRAWLQVDFRRRGRMLWRNLHLVAGTLALLFYVCSSLTGLFWSYDWYRKGLYALAGEPLPQRRGGGPGAPQDLDLSSAWAALQREVPAWRQATFMLPTAPGQPVQVSYLLPEAPHGRAVNRLEVDGVSGETREHLRYADKRIGGQLIASLFPLHSGEFFGWTGRILTALASLALPLFAITGWMLYLDRRRLRRRAEDLRRERLARGTAAPPQEQVGA